MKMLTKAISLQLPPIGAQDGKGDDAIAYVRYFDPMGSWTWYGTEYDPEERVFFGLVFGFETEYGYFTLDELESVGKHRILGIERDLHFNPTSIGEVKRIENRNRGLGLRQ